MNLKEDRMYTESYLWLEKEGKNIKAGIAKPAVEKAEKFLLLELPGEGDEIEKGEPVAEYEAMKRVGELASPAAFKVVDSNGELEDDPGKLSEDPWKNWILKLEPSQNFNMQDHMTTEEAEKYYEKMM